MTDRMSAKEAGRLLGLMAMYDNRTVAAPDVAAWLKVIGDLRYTDCETAVYAHYRESRERIMPADVRERVAAIRQARLDAAGPAEIPPELADRPIEAREWLQATRDAIADGQEPPLAIRNAR